MGFICWIHYSRLASVSIKSAYCKIPKCFLLFKIPPLSLWTHLFFGYCITLLSTIISRIKSHIHTHRNLGDTVAMHLCYSEQIHLAQFYPQKDKLTTVLYRGNNSNSSKEQIKYRPTIYVGLHLAK